MGIETTFRAASLAWGAVVLGFIGSAQAADLPVYKAQPTAVPAWSGAYVGGTAGWKRDEADWSRTGILSGFGFNPTPTNWDGGVGPHYNFESDAVRLGAYAGYNWQLSNFVVGIEADVGSGLRGKASLGYLPGGVVTGAAVPVGLNGTSVDFGWDGSIRGRVGVLVTPSTLLYTTGGFAFQRTTISAYCNNGGTWFCPNGNAESYSKLLTGWTLGGGVESMISRNWIARAEYRYTDLGRIEHILMGNGASYGLGADVDISHHQVNLGIAYKF
ncbi:outer membrane beta-barrel protein [Bradyrhizobium sp. CCH5-F6]|jgi:outer membrane immunogenic protein|uniref:outer membrane protein n=1 Tax=Bradyrhizobium sp. CCH5-F6 TaxID=1768753 RepID=UPI0009EC1B4A|nr:outer membrane beta-barrel protein [Bradyrhizobium sp. CCH5-F6]